MIFAERSNLDFDSRMYQRHAAMTVRSLVLVFKLSESDAQQAVRETLDRFPEQFLRDRLLHEDALNLAAVIANVHPTNLTKKPYVNRLAKYYAEAQKFGKAALNDYNAEGKRIENEARIRERARRLWEQEGRPAGSADEYWFRAEAEVAAERKPFHLAARLKTRNTKTPVRASRALSRRRSDRPGR
jgi:DUF2934 family protein